LKRIISPSLLSADFSNLIEDIKIVETVGVDRLHLDVMDGHFVPNLTFGPFIIKHIRKTTKCHLETHLMIDNPSKYIRDYANAGSDTIIIHYEASSDIRSDLNKIKDEGVLCGIAIKPETSYKVLEEYLDIIDYILVMSVSPGFGGQGFITETLDKMKSINKMCIQNNCREKIKIGVDGGVNLKTIKSVYDTGIDITIVGSGLYGASDVKKRYHDLVNEND